jgi:hypothetical protein
MSAESWRQPPTSGLHVTDLAAVTIRRLLAHRTIEPFTPPSA